MAATNYTPNFNLAIYGPNDDVSMMNTFNNDMNIIDTEMEKIKVTADAAEAGVGTQTQEIEKLNTELANTNSTVATQGVSIDGLKTQYTALSGEVVQAQGDIANLDADMTQAQSDINLNKTNIAANTQEISEIKTELEGITTPKFLPDYENAINIDLSTQYIAQENGYITFNAAISTSSQTISIIINNKKITVIEGNESSADSIRTLLFIPVGKNDTIELEGNITPTNQMFIPMK